MRDYALVSVVIPAYKRKDKLEKLLCSIFKSDYPDKGKLKVIVVIDADEENYDNLMEMFPNVNFLFNETEKMVAETRNVGIKHSKGQYILLIDNDNIVDKKCISELVNFMESHPDVGVAGPIMYYLRDPERIWCAGVKRNYYTSLTQFIGRNEIDDGQFLTPVPSEDFPNAFIIKRDVIDKIGFFDSKNFPIHYEEADFCKRVSNIGYKICLVPTAKVWHNIPLPEEVKHKARFFHIHNEYRAYYAGRNRVLFHKKYSQWWQFFIFISVFNWFFIFYYLHVILFSSGKLPLKDRVKNAYAFLRGGFEWGRAKTVIFKPKYDVVIISRYNPWGKGGLESVVKEQVATLADKKMLVFFRRQKENEKIPMRKPAIYTINDRISSVSGVISDLIYTIPTYLTISRFDTKVVLDNFDFSALCKLFSTMIKKNSLIIKVHHGTPNYLDTYTGLKGILAKIYSLFFKPFYSFSSRVINLNIAVSQKIKKELIKSYRVPAQNIIVIRNGLDTDKFKPRDKTIAREKLKLPENQKIILFVGGDLERKGFKEAFQVVKTLKKEFKDILFLVVTRAKMKTNNHIKILNDVPGDLINLVYNASDVLLLPSKYEAAPLTVLEALASGCPAVVSPHAAEEEWNGEGYLIAHNHFEYVKFCRNLLEDEEYWREMGLKARYLVTLEYKLNKQHDAYSKILSQILRNN